MTAPRVLRVPRSDEPEAFVLVHVAHQGPAVLDLALTATEGECPYTALVRETSLDGFRAKNYQGDRDEWARIVSFVLGQFDPTSERAVAGIEALATITGSGDEDREIVITIRKRVQSITQRLGVIVLRQDDEQAIGLFEWTGTAVAQADSLVRQVVDLQDRYRTAEDTIKRLNERLEDLTRDKSAHETELMTHFAQLLNEKKLKIRNQQRLLASATADIAQVSKIQGFIGQSSMAAGSHQGGKRRDRDTEDTGEDTDEGFEQMNIDQDTDNEGPSTPQPLEEGGTATDNETDVSLLATPAKLKEAVNVKRSALEQSAPPRRELPFIPRGQPSTSRSVAEANEATQESFGESDDDEL